MATPPGFTPTPPAGPPPLAPAPQPIGDPPSVQERINAINARNAELTAELAAAKAAAAQVETYRRQAVEANRRADAAHIPLLRNPDVSAHVSGQYDAYAARTGDSAKTFADWLASDAANNPLVSPYLATPAAPPPPATPATPTTPAAPPPNPSAGVIPPGATPPLTVFSRAAVEAMSQADVRANLAAVVAAAAADGDVRYTPPAPRT